MSWGDGIPNPFEEERRDELAELRAENQKLKEALKTQAFAMNTLESSIRKSAEAQAIEFLNEKLAIAKRNHDAVYAMNEKLTDELDLLRSRLEDSGLI